MLLTTSQSGTGKDGVLVRRMHHAVILPEHLDVTFPPKSLNVGQQRHSCSVQSVDPTQQQHLGVGEPSFVAIPLTCGVNCSDSAPKAAT